MEGLIAANLALAAWNLLLGVGNLAGAPWVRWSTKSAVIAWAASSVVVWTTTFLMVL